MKNFNKYLTNALKIQNTNEILSQNNDYNINKYGTTFEVYSLVKKAQWEFSGFLKNKINKKQFLLWHSEQLKQGAL